MSVVKYESWYKNTNFTIMPNAYNVNSLNIFSHTFQVEMLLHALSLNQKCEKM